MRSLLFENGLIKWQAFLFWGRLYFKKKKPVGSSKPRYLRLLPYKKKNLVLAKWRHLDLEFFPPHTI